MASSFARGSPTSVLPVHRTSGALTMSTSTRVPALGALLAVLLLFDTHECRGQLPPSTLAVRTDSGWVTWWRASRAPRQWSAPHPALTAALRWRPVRAGVEVASLDLTGSGEAWRIRAIIARIEPERLRFRLDLPPRRRAAWNVEALGDDAIVACNAGQFREQGPWGWIVRDGKEVQAPGRGPLVMAVVVDSGGGVRLVSSDSVAALRAAGRVETAFQSYPALLQGAAMVPRQLTRTDAGLDVTHRDSRLALGLLPDGSLLLVLTRFHGLGGVLSPMPVGLTIPETAALMGALGARRAVALDGGTSGQLLVRDEAGIAEMWTGWRKVPLGFVGELREGMRGASVEGRRR